MRKYNMVPKDLLKNQHNVSAIGGVCVTFWEWCDGKKWNIPHAQMLGYIIGNTK